MRGTNRKRSLIVSGGVILLCMTVVVGMTWALFTDTHTVKNHLQAGDLEITLERTALTKTTLDEQGFLKGPEVIKNAEHTFTEPDTENVFGIGTDEKVVPGSEFVASMKVTNGSDVAFKYWIRIDCKDEDVAKVLAQQLTVTVYTDKNGDGKIDTNDVGDAAAISNGLEVGDDKNAIGVVAVGGAEEFIVSVKFEDKGYTYIDGVLTSDNDAAQMDDVEFDLIVYAVQETTAP